MPNSLIEIFGEPISTYSRAQAIEDGFLVDVSSTAKEAGFKHPVALTSEVYEDCVAWDKADSQRKKTHQDESGRLWDVVYMAMLAAKRTPGSEFSYIVHRVPKEGKGVMPQAVTLIAKCTPGDTPEPVITISS